MTASVLIDLYALRPDEVRTIVKSLTLLRQASLGQMGELISIVDRVLAHGADEEQRNEIAHLFSEMNRVLWSKREPWTLFDRRKASIHGVLAHGLECRLLRNEEELMKVNQHLRSVLKYHPFHSGESQ